MDVGFIGLGLMGRAIARNIAGAGHSVRAWNRSPVPDAASDGLKLVSSPAEVFDADAIFTMLSDDAAIRDTVLASGALASARAGAVHVVTSTISLGFVEELRAAHEAAGIGYVAAPVFGRPDVAEAAKLNVVAAGAPEAIAAVRPLLDAIGQKTWVMGRDPKQANAAKIAGNMMIAMAIEAMAEAVALTGQNGVAPEAFLELALGTLFGGRAYQNYSAKIISGDVEPGFKMELGLKDLRLAAAAAESSGQQLPMLDAVRGRMGAAVEAGMGQKDWSAVAGFAFPRSG